VSAVEKAGLRGLNEGQRVSFLPGRAPSREMLKQAEQMLSTP